MTGVIPAGPVQAGRLRSALAWHAAAVVVVTGPGPAGLTVTTFNSASLDPPLVSFYVARSSATWPRLRAARVFGANVLAADQGDIADRFARRDTDRFGPGLSWRSGPLGVPLIDGAACHVCCELDTVVAVGDHWLVVGLVIDVGSSGAAPLLRHRGHYGWFSGDLSGDFGGGETKPGPAAVC
ncbi:MAG TPA: flavin reductase family protein [Streptosporangiaceae bacterium]|jgi:flavin reductase (DIM6/NTAB) family NADH-FMN oxidoreductase RutF